MSNAKKNCNHQDGVGLFDEWFPNKVFRPKITCKAGCPLSHAHRMTLGYLIYKMRDEKPVPTASIIEALGLERKTVLDALAKLKGWGLAEGNRSGHRAVEVPADKVSWFAWRKGDGRIATHRVYTLTRDAKRTNRKPGSLTESDNSLLWLMYSLASANGGREIVNKPPRRLAVMLASSHKTVKESIERLQGNGLLMPRSDGYTLIQPGETALAWWRDRKVKGERPEPEQKEREEKTKTINLEAIVNSALPRWSVEDQALITSAMVPCTRELEDAAFSRREIADYWTKAVPRFPDPITAILFLTEGWGKLLAKARLTHAEKGRHRSCYHLFLDETLKCKTLRNDLRIVDCVEGAEADDFTDIGLQDELC